MLIVTSIYIMKYEKSTLRVRKYSVFERVYIYLSDFKGILMQIGRKTMNAKLKKKFH